MARKPQKWPHYALWALEDTLVLLHEIQDLSRRAQMAAKENNRLEVVILNGDIREKAGLGVTYLVRARSGEYENEPDEG